MVKKLHILAMMLATAFASCQKIGILKSRSKGLTSGLVVPKGFSWESSRNIKIKVSVTDHVLGNYPFLIALYDHDPALGGNTIAKGSATLKMAFETAIYLSKQVTTIYIVKTASDNARIISKVNVENSNIEISLGAPVLIPATGIKRAYPVIKS